MPAGSDPEPIPRREAGKKVDTDQRARTVSKLSSQQVECPYSSPVWPVKKSLRSISQYHMGKFLKNSTCAQINTHFARTHSSKSKHIELLLRLAWDRCKMMGRGCGNKMQEEGTERKALNKPVLMINNLRMISSALGSKRRGERIHEKLWMHYVNAYEGFLQEASSPLNKPTASRSQGPGVAARAEHSMFVFPSEWQQPDESRSLKETNKIHQATD